MLQTLKTGDYCGPSAVAGEDLCASVRPSEPQPLGHGGHDEKTSSFWGL